MKENFKKLVKNLEEIGFIGKSEIIDEIFQKKPKDIISNCLTIRDFAGIDYIPTFYKDKKSLINKTKVIELAEETESLLNNFFITNLTYSSGDPSKKELALKSARHLRDLCCIIVLSGGSEN